MSRHRSIAMLMRVLICTALAVPHAAFATLCFRISPQEFLEKPALIFEGSITGVAVREKYIVTTYRIGALYKGIVSGDRVDVASACGSFGDNECPKEPTYSSERHILAVYAWGSSVASLAPFVTSECMSWSAKAQPPDYLPYLDRYRVALVNAYRRAESAPRSTERWDAVAALQLKHHDYLGALDTLQKLRTLAPTRQQYVVQTGDSLRGLERFPEALEQYEAALKLGPNGDDVRAGKFRVYAATGRFAEIDADWRDFSTMDLYKVTFVGRSMQGARFIGTRLERCDFTDTDLTGADFSDSSTTDCTFTGAVLRNAKLQRTKLDSFELPKGDLSGADLTGVSLYGAQLPGADLSRTDLTDADLKRADLSGANLKGANFVRTRLIEADLSDTDLSGADLRRIQLQGAILRNTKLVGANLRGAYLAGLPVGQRGPSNVGDWKPANLMGADLTDAILTGADLRLAYYDCTTKFPRGFVPRGLTKMASEECPEGPSN